MAAVSLVSTQGTSDTHFFQNRCYDVSMSMHEDKRERVTFLFGVAIAAVWMVIVLGLIIAQVYIRWSINQSFTLLGGFELEALTFSTFALILGLVYLHRSNR